MARKVDAGTPFTAAVFKVSVHVPSFLRATRLFRAIEQPPPTLHLSLPFEGGRIIDRSDIDLRTLRTITGLTVADRIDDEVLAPLVATTETEYDCEAFKEVNLQLVVVDLHTMLPGLNVAMKLRPLWLTSVTVDHVATSVLLPLTARRTRAG